MDVRPPPLVTNAELREADRRRARLSLRLGEGAAVGLDDADDDAEEPEGAAEDLDDQHLDEEVRLLRVAERAAGARHADADAAEEVGQADREADSEEAVPRRDRLRLPAPGLGRDHELLGAIHLVAHDD